MMPTQETSKQPTATWSISIQSAPDRATLDRVGRALKGILEQADVHSVDVHLLDRGAAPAVPEVPERVSQDASFLSMYGEAVLSFGSPARALRWLMTPVEAFGNRPPRDFVDSAEGRDQIRAELHRIELGIF